MSAATAYHELVRHLVAALNGRRIYPPQHPVLDRTLSRLEQALHHLMVSRDEVQLGVLGTRLLADGLPWQDQEEPLSLLSQELRARGVDKLTFQRGFTRADLDSLLEVLSGDRAVAGAQIPDAVPVADLLAGRGVSRIRLGHLDLEKEDASTLQTATPSERGAYEDAVSGLTDAMDCARTGRFIRTRHSRARLSDAEFEIIRRHPIDSLHLLRETPGVGDLSLIVAFEHHRRYDLTGYPALPRQVPQHFASRLVALADAYDAMRSNRSYQREVPPEQALQIIQQQSGKMFDPLMVRLFIRMMGAFPPGTRVRLDTGEEAMVLKAGPEDPHRPIVRLVDGMTSEGDRLRLVNLSERDPKTGNYLRSVTCSLP